MASDVALDLGTSGTQVFVRGKGIVAEEPTVVAVDRRTNDVVDVGAAALGRAAVDGGVDLVWPVRNGAVAEPAVLQQLLGRLLKPYVGGFRDRLRVVVAVSSSTTPVERRSVREASKRAGASEVHLIEHVMAAALGGDLPLHEPVATMVVDVGAGITEAALLSLGYVVGSSSVRSGGFDVDLAIKSVLRREYGMVISERTAEEIKLAVSSAPGDDAFMVEARGETSVDGSTMTAILERDDVQHVLDAHLAAAVEAVKATLIQAPPELAQDLFTRGIHLAGGAARIGGLCERLEAEFGLPVHVLPDPDRVVVTGAAKCLEAMDRLKDLFIGES